MNTDRLLKYFTALKCNMWLLIIATLHVHMCCIVLTPHVRYLQLLLENSGTGLAVAETSSLGKHGMC